jgi:preprotein translocase subunit SecA
MSPSNYTTNSRPVAMMKKLFGQITGSPLITDLADYWGMAEKIRAFQFSEKTDAELAERTREIACRSANSLSELKLEVFGLACEASRRTLALDPFDSQIIAGLAMADGGIAELPTGEGKTLAAVFPACFHALSGRNAHILTFNDYLARRDAAWMSPVYRTLGLSVGCIQEGMSVEQKKSAYSCHITYASAKEAGFDFLRDQTVYDRKVRVHRSFGFAIVDEADSILIDEARIPLVISGVEDRVTWDSHQIAAVVKALVPERDFDTDEEHRNVFLTDAGTQRVESLLACCDLYAANNQTLLEAIYCALHAEALLRRDVDYIVRNGRIEIVDEYTGRVVDKRHWPDGLQAAVEAKEGLRRKTAGRILGSITLQHFFRLYPILSGMTATAHSAADEFHKFYGLKTFIVPPHTPSIRVDHPDEVFADRETKQRAMVHEICQVHATGRPILVGTSSVGESEELAAAMRSARIRCSVLNAKNDELEADIIAKAGKLGAVTVSTNMAGRGVDIKLGGQDKGGYEAVAAMGGLYVIGTNRHESVRIDRQLRGRAGRQGDPGATRFFISLEDDLFEHYGLTAGLLARYRRGNGKLALNHRVMRYEIAHAQRVIENQNFDIRRSLHKYSSLVELQRKIVQDRRDKALQSNEMLLTERSAVLKPILAEKGLRRFGPQGMAELERHATLFHLDRLWSNHLAWIQDTRDSIHLVNLGGREPFDEFSKQATAEFLNMQNRLEEAIVEEMTTIIQTSDMNSGLERLKGPSSTWTYLVNENPFGSGMEMIKGKNIGLAFGIAFGGLFGLNILLHLAALILDRRGKRR